MLPQLILLDQLPKLHLLVESKIINNDGLWKKLIKLDPMRLTDTLPYISSGTEGGTEDRVSVAL